MVNNVNPAYDDIRASVRHSSFRIDASFSPSTLRRSMSVIYFIIPYRYADIHCHFFDRSRYTRPPLRCISARRLTDVPACTGPSEGQLELTALTCDANIVSAIADKTSYVVDVSPCFQQLWRNSAASCLARRLCCYVPRPVGAQGVPITVRTYLRLSSVSQVLSIRHFYPPLTFTFKFPSGP